jgi:hypothetical protein
MTSGTHIVMTGTHSWAMICLADVRAGAGFQYLSLDPSPMSAIGTGQHRDPHRRADVTS